MSCLKQQNVKKNQLQANTIYEEVNLEKDKKTNKYLNSIPQKFLIPRLNFKTEQILSYFTQDIIDLI
jgi:hypothetical protein